MSGGTGEGTRAVRAGLPDPVKYEPTLPGPVFAAHFHLPGEPTGPYTYGRDDNPTWTHLERAIGELEAPGEAVQTVTFASGMAAISAVLFSQLKAGDAVVLPDDGYQALPLVREQLEAYGIEVRTAPTGGDPQLAVLAGARLLWIESPSNPGLDVCDIRRLVRAAHAAGALVAVDNTLATPAGAAAAGSGCRLLGGQRHQGHDRPRRHPAGACHLPRRRPGRGGTALAQGRRRDPRPHGGLARTPLAGHAPAAVRAAVRERDRAGGGARRARGRHRAAVSGAADDPSHQVASQQMRRFGCVVSFVLPDREHAERFLDALRLVDDATSFGGCARPRPAARALGRGCGAGGFHPALGRRRGRGRPRGGCTAGAGRAAR